MEDQLGYQIRGTTDAALVLSQAVGAGVADTGSKWLWVLKKKLHAMAAVAEVAAAEEELTSGPTTHKAVAASTVTLQVAEVLLLLSLPAFQQELLKHARYLLSACGACRRTRRLGTPSRQWLACCSPTSIPLTSGQASP